ncbi:3-isopropylmalate dehydrogenase [Tyzzerella sp. OttesenSCG-928-J15]|nr:3-isopropylmalate dehydrogenase [Tyzzerella sp. OttesenSCG-928-J15]
MDFNIALLPGDGIGPEVVGEAVKALEAIGKKYGHNFNFQNALVGGAAIDKYGEPFPEETKKICENSQAILLGAVGGPKWDKVAYDKRPEAGLLGLRGHFGLYANLRPAIMYDEFKDACPLKSEIIGGGINIMVVRELTGGIYFGERGEGGEGESRFAWDTEKYSYNEIYRIAKTAFDIAMVRNKHVTSIDKANVLKSSVLWRQVVTEVGESYPEVTLDHMYVDNASMQLIKKPGWFDVVVTNNIFGDILSDEASEITGSIGLLPSACMNENKFGMYEPIHGSAPDIAGQAKANPIATILSAAMMLKYSLDLEEEAAAIEKAVQSAISKGARTADIAAAGEVHLSTTEMGLAILKEIE